MKGFVKQLLTVAVAAQVGFFVCFPQQAYGEDPDITEAGDTLQILLPALAWTSTFLAGNPEGGLWDKEGTKQATYSIGTSLATMGVWKGLAGKMRPAASSRTSFPSGHTTAAFSGASFIGTRYGWVWGTPAYAAAVFTGYSRYQADAHFADDVIAGAGLAMLVNWAYVTPQHERVTVMPMVNENTVGVMVSIKDMAPSSDVSEKRRRKNFKPKFRFELASGPAFLNENKIKAPSDTGTEYDLFDFNKEDDPTTTAAINFEYFLNKRHTFSFFYNPFDSRDTGTLSYPVSFAGDIYPANTPLVSSWRVHDLRVRWHYNFMPPDRWNINFGLGVMYQHLRIALNTQDGTITNKVYDEVVLPFLLGSVGYEITPEWEFITACDGTYIDSDWMVDLTFSLKYHINEQWDASLGYQYYAREIETSELMNKVEYDVMPYISVGHSW